MVPFTTRRERERLREGKGRVSEGKSFFGSTMESKESEERREEREEHLPGGQGGSSGLASINGNPTIADLIHTVASRDATERSIRHT